MLRKWLLAVLCVFVVLSVSAAGWAQELWQWNNFTAQYEKLYYEIVTRETMWDYELGEDVKVEKKYYQLLELRQIDADNTEITQGYTFVVPRAEVGEQLNFMGGGYFALPMFSGSGGFLAEYMMLTMFASELELELGNSMQLFDGSRVRILDEEAVAGVRGYVVRKSVRETDEAGNRVEIVTSEWVIAPEVGWPLRVQVYDGDEVVYSMTLVEYERR